MPRCAEVVGTRSDKLNAAEKWGSTVWLVTQPRWETLCSDNPCMDRFILLVLCWLSQYRDFALAARAHPRVRILNQVPNGKKARFGGLMNPPRFLDEDNYSLVEGLTKIYGGRGNRNNHSICLLVPSKFKVKCMQSAALKECVRARALPACTPVTLTHVVTVVTRVRSAVQKLDS